MSKSFLQLFVLAALLLGLAVGCAPQSTPTPTKPPVPTPTSVPNTAVPLPSPTRVVSPTPGPTPTQTVPPTPGPRENLLATYDAALPKIKSYRVEVITDPSRQDDPERIVEVILPDRFRQTQGGDIRQIGNEIYFLVSGKSGTTNGLWPVFERVNLPWYRNQFAQAAVTTLLGRSVVFVNKTQFQVIGYQTTVKVLGINASDPKTFGRYADQPIKVWFAANNGFPVRMEIGQPVLYINGFYDINGKIDEIGPP